MAKAVDGDDVSGEVGLSSGAGCFGPGDGLGGVSSGGAPRLLGDRCRGSVRKMTCGPFETHSHTTISVCSSSSHHTTPVHYLHTPPHIRCLFKTISNTYMCPCSTKAVISNTGIFVAIANNTLHVSKLLIFCYAKND